jgi:hypothetical protein
MIWAFRSLSSETVSRLLSVLAVLAASVAVTTLSLPNPLADVFFAGVVTLSVVFALVGVIGAWTNRTPLVWVAALLSTGLSLLGMLSIGLFLLPSSVLLLGSAVFSQLGGPRTSVRASILASPPTEREVRRKTLVGTGTTLVGGGLVYVGAFTQELFGSCARETLACALETTDWSAVGLTVFGLLGVSYGVWVLWRQAYVTRVLVSTGSR